MCSDVQLNDMNKETGEITTTHQWFNKSSIGPNEQIRIKGRERYDADKKILNVQYEQEADKNHVNSFDDLRILTTDFDSYVVSYSRNLNAMWVMTMPVPDECM